jgi:hypothetical protein
MRAVEVVVRFEEVRIKFIHLIGKALREVRTTTIIATNQTILVVRSRLSGTTVALEAAERGKQDIRRVTFPSTAAFIGLQL